MSNLTDRIGDVEPERFYVLRFCFGGGRNILVCLMSDAAASRRLGLELNKCDALKKQSRQPGGLAFIPPYVSHGPRGVVGPMIRPT
jgi:hypothetical protein